MALLVDCADTIIGVPMTGTYARVTGFQGDKRYVMLTVEHYANEQARNSNAQAVAMRTYTAPVTEFVGGLPSMYEWLKQQPDYAAAEDC
jgi:hypothetical protein